MILARLASALRRQDWFQVVIEVLIVIVGIFLGLQVQAWYEGRADRGLEQVYLERLLSETEATLIFQQAALNQYDIAIKGNRLVLSALQSGVLAEKDVSDFYQGFDTFNSIAPLRREDNTLQELRNAGNMAIISNAELQNTLNRILAAYELYDGQIGYTRDRIGRQVDNIIDIIYVDHDLSMIINKRQDVDNFYRPIQSFDAFKDNIKLRSHVAQILRDKTAARTFLIQFTAATKSLRDQLEDEIMKNQRTEQ